MPPAPRPSKPGTEPPRGPPCAARGSVFEFSKQPSRGIEGMKLRLLTLSFALVLLPGAVFAQAPVRVMIPGVRVDVAPPPPQVEVRPAPPGPGHTWIAGHWAW